MIMPWLYFGARSELLSSPELWKCCQCHVCVAHCPQDARPADVIRTLRNLAVKEGYITPETAIRFDSIDEEFKKLRLSKVREVIEAEF